MLYIIKTSDDTIIINAKEKKSAQAIGESTYTFQPTLRFLFFQHQLKIVCGTFCYQSLQIHHYDDYYILSINKNISIHKCKITTNYPKTSTKVFVSYSSKHH